MSELEQAVIKAAREWLRNPGSANRFALEDAINALEESLKPDVWVLLERSRNTIERFWKVTNAGNPRPKLARDIEKALEWRRTHE